MIRIRIKEVAEEKGLSMAKIARRADMDFKTVQRLFHNPYRDISLSTLEKIAKALGVSATSLIEETPRNREQSTTQPDTDDNA